jgi:hypothetical protein
MRQLLKAVDLYLAITLNCLFYLGRFYCIPNLEFSSVLCILSSLLSITWLLARACEGLLGRILQCLPKLFLYYTKV